MNEETFKIICRAHFPECEFFRTPIGNILARIQDGGFKWRIASFSDFGEYGSRWEVHATPGLIAADLYEHLRKQDRQKTR